MNKQMQILQLEPLNNMSLLGDNLKATSYNLNQMDKLPRLNIKEGRNPARRMSGKLSRRSMSTRMGSEISEYERDDDSSQMSNCATNFFDAEVTENDIRPAVQAASCSSTRNKVFKTFMN